MTKDRIAFNFLPLAALFFLGVYYVFYHDKEGKEFRTCDCGMKLPLDVYACYNCKKQFE